MAWLQIVRPSGFSSISSAAQATYQVSFANMGVLLGLDLPFTIHLAATDYSVY
ncbi:MAG: hypothetical protein ABIR55_19210 [Burkholderiaceae bacterium]